MSNLISANISRIFRLASADIRRKPDYMIIGAQKSGTTTLFDLLSQHPDIRNPANKEMHYFDNRDIFSLREYRSMYPISRDKLTGEATPIYLYYPGVPERIKSVFPACKFIAILRNPVYRAYSHYQMRVRRGKEPLSFEEAIAAEEQRLTQAKEELARAPHRHNDGLLAHSYVDRGVYCRQLENWYSIFDRRQLHVISYEHFISQPLREYGRLCDFLGIARCDKVSLAQSNAYNYPDMLPTTKAQLQDYYQPFNQQLFELIEEEFPWDGASA